MAGFGLFIVPCLVTWGEITCYFKLKNLTLVLNIYRFSCVFILLLLSCSRTNIQPQDGSSFSVQIYRQTSELKGKGRYHHLAEFLFGIGYGWVCYCFRLFMRYECP